MNVFLIEQNDNIYSALVQALEPHGYRITRVKSLQPQTDRDAISASTFLIMEGSRDIYKTKQDIEKVREISQNIYILIIDKSLTIQDRLKLMEFGADDILVFPFRVEEIIVKLKSLGRRAKSYSPTVLEQGSFKVDIWNRKVYRNKEFIPLTNREFDLFIFMLKRYGQVVSRQDINNFVWRYKQTTYSNTIDVHVKRLRDKLGDKELIKTVYGYGYKFEEEESEESEIPKK